MLALSMLPLCVTVCLLHASIVSEWLNLGPHKQLHMIARELQFSLAKDLGEISMGSPQMHVQ